MLTKRKFSQQDLNFFHADSHSAEIIQMAKALSRPRILAHYGVDDFDELTIPDQYFFDYHFDYGRNQAACTAVDKLFEQMKGRHGVEAIKLYLSHMSSDWEDLKGHPSSADSLPTFGVTLTHDNSMINTDSPKH